MAHKLVLSILHGILPCICAWLPLSAKPQWLKKQHGASHRCCGNCATAADDATGETTYPQFTLGANSLASEVLKRLLGILAATHLRTFFKLHGVVCHADGESFQQAGGTVQKTRGVDSIVFVLQVAL
eukprot:5001755-Amphidinium_carterae.1